MKIRLHICSIGLTAGIVFCLVASFAYSAASAAEPKRILLLHSFGRDFSPWSEYAKQIRAELNRQILEPIDIFEASLAIARFSEGNREEPFAAYLHSLFENRKLDLAVTIGAPAAIFFNRHHLQIAPTTPAVFMGLEQRRIPPVLASNEITISSVIDFSGAIRNALHVLPKTNNIAVVIGNSSLEKFWLQRLRQDFGEFTDRVAFSWFNELSFQEMLARGATLPPQSAIFFVVLSVDAAGMAHEESKAVERLSAVANAPMFAWSDVYLGKGIVGGPLTPAAEAARKAAGVAVRILNGEAPSSAMAETILFGTPRFDWREMQRWGISESRLTPGSEIHFRSPTAWEQYRWQILGALGIVAAQGLMIAGLLVERRRRRAAEVESRRHLMEVMHLNRVATAGELSASIAHEINQPLAAIVLSANVGMRWLSNAAPNLEEVAAALKRIVSDGHRASGIIDTVRAMFKKDTLRRTSVDPNELIREALTLSHTDLEEHHISVSSVLTEGLPRVLVDRTQFRQVIMNLVRNAIDAMNSVSDRVLRVRSEAGESDEVIITIEDSGPGIDPKHLDKIFEPFFTTKSSGMGMGLSICRSIIEDHGGRLSAGPGKRRGARFEVVFPHGEDVRQ